MTLSNDQVKKYPEWEPHTHPDYDAILHADCGVQLQRLRAGPSSIRRHFLADPRAVHKALYGQLTPPGYEEYAGTYRGTVGTTLEHRYVASDPFGEGATYCFARPEEVEKCMALVSGTVDRFFLRSTWIALKARCSSPLLKFSTRLDQRILFSMATDTSNA